MCRHIDHTGTGWDLAQVAAVEQMANLLKDMELDNLREQLGVNLLMTK